MWTVLFGDLFDAWLDEQEDGLQEKVLADLINLRTYGPALSRPYADTVKGSRHKNAKWHLNRSMFGIRIDHDLACISDRGLASQSITIWHASDH